MRHHKSQNPDRDLDRSWQRTRGGDQVPSTFDASGNWHFHGQEIKEVPGENPDIIRAVCSEGQVSKI